MSFQAKLRAALVKAAERRNREAEAEADELEYISNTGFIPTSWVRRHIWKER